MDRPRLRFGAFLAPHHPTGEHPTLLMRRDIELGAHLDRLGLDEYWVGEHHSSGWETIGSPELLLAAVGERTERIMLGTGVISLPYHQPFMVAQRMVQLDHMTRGRAMFGSGPGALPSDAAMFGIDSMLLRGRQDEALGIITALLRGEKVSYECEWFRLKDAELQILPLQGRIPMAVASTISPSGMRLAGKYGIGVLSIASTSTEGLQALPMQWAFAEEAAAEHGQQVSRSDWRVLMAFHLAETRDRARAEAVHGLGRWHNEYNVRVLGRPNALHYDDPWELLDISTGVKATSGAAGTAVVGTPDDLVDQIVKLYEITGGFGCLIGFAHDWADREATWRSWELFARYVVPAVNGYTRGLIRSADRLSANKGELMANAGRAIMAEISRSPKAMEAFAVTLQQNAPTSAGASAAAGGALAGFAGTDPTPTRPPETAAPGSATGA